MLYGTHLVHVEPPPPHRAVRTVLASMAVSTYLGKLIY